MVPAFLVEVADGRRRACGTRTGKRAPYEGMGVAEYMTVRPARLSGSGMGWRTGFWTGADSGRVREG